MLASGSLFFSIAPFQQPADSNTRLQGESYAFNWRLRSVCRNGAEAALDSAQEPLIGHVAEHEDPEAGRLFEGSTVTVRDVAADPKLALKRHPREAVKWIEEHSCVRLGSFRVQVTHPLTSIPSAYEDRKSVGSGGCVWKVTYAAGIPYPGSTGEGDYAGVWRQLEGHRLEV